MKKALSIILSLCMLLSLSAIPAFAANNGLKLTVASDLHVSQQSAVVSETDNAYEYASSNANPAMRLEAKAIFTKFLEQAAISGSDYLLISGDLVNAGTLAEHEYMVSALEAFEAESGIEVLVINGNHDVMTETSDGVKASPDDFKRLYANLGYGEAVAVDDNSCSYVYDLSSGYRLIAIDTCNYKSSADGLTAERTAWVKAQLKAASDAGKKVITMTHHAITEHFAYHKNIMSDYILNNADSFASMLADSGVLYNFSGHIHMNDIVKYTSAKLNAVYDVETTSLSMYPAAYRTVNFSDSSVEFKTEYIKSIDTSLVASGANSASLKAMEDNFTEYTYGCFAAGVNSIVYRRLASPAWLASKLGEEGSAEYNAAIKLLTKLSGIYYYPLYKADETVKGESFESLAEKYGMSVSASDYKTYTQVIAKFASEFYEGDENLSAKSTEMKVVKDCLKIGVAYVLDGEDETTAGVLASLVQRLTGKNIPAKVTDIIAGSLDISQFANVFIDYYLGLIVETITVDSSVADNDVSLESYSVSSPEYNKLANFLDGLLSFLRKIFSILQNFFK